jgi:hypothetical protein
LRHQVSSMLEQGVVARGAGRVGRSIAHHITTLGQVKGSLPPKITTPQTVADRRKDSKKRTIVLEGILGIVRRGGSAESLPPGRGINLLLHKFLGMEDIHTDADEGIAHALAMEDGFDIEVVRTPRDRPRVAPQPPVTLEEYERTKDLRCLYCPRPSDTHTFPPQVPLESAPWCSFRCGCRIHTICFALRIKHGDDYFHRCPVCETSLLTPEQARFYRQNFAERDDPDEKQLEKLWETNETFREEVREVAQVYRKTFPFQKVFRQEKNQLLREWKEATSSMTTILRNQKASFMKRFAALPSRMKYIQAYGKYRMKLRRVMATYDLGYFALFRRRRPKGMPRLSEVSRYSSWRESPRYLFRVRI